MDQNNHSQQGQAMIIMVLGLVVLLGMVALAIDGGRAYTERRVAQNTADASAMAAVRELGSGASSITAKQVAINTAAQNGYELDPEQIIVMAHENSYNNRTVSYDVEVNIDSTIDSTFANFIFGDSLNVGASSKMEVRLLDIPMAGFGIVTLATACPKSNQGVLDITGGGGSNKAGGIRTFGGSMWANVATSDDCVLGPGSSNATSCAVGGLAGICALNDDGSIGSTFQIYSAGSHAYGGEGKIGPNPIQVNQSQISDPLAGLAEPTCVNTGQTNYPYNGQVYTYGPGNWSGGSLGEGTYAPGIYCINGDVKTTGNGTMSGDGVLLFFKTGGLSLSGNGSMVFTAPKSNNCLGEIGETDASCTYQKIVLWGARNNTEEFDIGGNGESHVRGTIYLPDAQINGHGGGSAKDEALVWGQVIVKNVLNNGQGSLDVWYNEDWMFSFPPHINALQ